MAANASTAPFTEIGIISRSQGLKGELKVQFETNSLDVVQNLEIVYLQNSRGDYFPCRIKKVRTEGKEDRISFFVHFEHIADRNEADLLRGKPIFIETDKATGFLEDETEEFNYLDFEVLDHQNQHKGLVIDEIDNGAQLVIVVATTLGTLMIPLVDQFVDEINEAESLIRCKNLDLLEG
jgi:16S rRNA processing protein RimM